MIFIGIAYWIINYIGKNSFELSKSKKHDKLANFIFGASIAGLIIFTVIMSKILSSIVIFSLNITYVAIIVGVYWIYKGVNKFIIKSE